MTTEQVKLKPCPMGCAGDVIGGEHEGASVYCKVCWLRAVSPEAWNTRIDPPSPDAGERREAIARAELAALANLIERPPLDDVVLERNVALRSAKAIRVVLATSPAPHAANLGRDALAKIIAEYQERMGLATEDAWNDGWGIAEAILEAAPDADTVDADTVMVPRELLARLEKFVSKAGLLATNHGGWFDRHGFAAINPLCDPANELLPAIWPLLATSQVKPEPLPSPEPGEVQ